MGNSNRRTVLKSAATLAALSALPRNACAADAAKYTVIAEGLGAPEGPKCLPDGSVMVCEMANGHLSRARLNGKVETIADLGGTPNGSALGPDGAAYVCNNGGLKFVRAANGLWQTAGATDTNKGGYIQYVDVKTGTFKTLYDSVNGNKLSAPNDLVFDNTGGFWFSDSGTNHGRYRDYGGLYWAKADGSEIREIAFGYLGPNGIALSPDGKTLYMVVAQSRQILSYQVEAPGVVKKAADGKPAVKVLISLGGTASFDSMAMEADGTLVAASPAGASLKLFNPDGTQRDEVNMGEAVTNVTFGGADMKTAYVTLVGSGRLVSVPWPRPGLKPAYT